MQGHIRNILVTGATGYIGQHLIKRLVEDKRNKVTILVRPNSNLTMLNNYKNDIKIHQYQGTYESVESLFTKQELDCIIHLAGFVSLFYASEQITSMIDANITLGTYLLECMQKYNCQYFINTSSYSQHYGGSQYYSPNSLYAATKKAFEDIVDFYCINGKIKAISLMLYDVYGYNDHRKKFLNLLIYNNQTTLRASPGDQKLRMIFIDDVIDAYQVAMELITTVDRHEHYGVYNQEKHTLKEIVTLWNKISKKNSVVVFGARDYDRLQIMEPYIGRILTNWSAKTTLKDGLIKIWKLINE